MSKIYRQEDMNIYEAHKGWPNADPSDAQKMWMNLKFGLMFHFGVNTYNDLEWSDGSLPASSFNPTSLNTDEWCEAAKLAGANYVMPVAKHMDGFCLWKTNTSSYGITSSPFSGDIIQNVANSAKKVGLKFALYYSLWDVNNQENMTDLEFTFLIKRQLTELLTRYGEVVEIWIDGTWSKGGIDFHDAEAWHWREIYEHIKSIQPDCMVGVNPTTHHPGKIVLWPCDFRIGEKSSSSNEDRLTWYCGNKPHFLPWEGVYTLSTGGSGDGLFADGKWFWHEDDNTVHPPEWVAERLKEMDLAGGNLLLNAPITKEGKLRACDTECLKKLPNYFHN